MKPNWFVGLRVPPEAGVTAKVKGPPEGVRLFAEADLHMTVAFLGAAGEAAASAREMTMLKITRSFFIF